MLKVNTVLSLVKKCIPNVLKTKNTLAHIMPEASKVLSESAHILPESGQRAIEKGLSSESALEFLNYAKKIEQEGKKNIAPAIDSIRGLLPDSMKDCVVGRSKGYNSIVDKIFNDFSRKGIKDLQGAINAVDDLIGTRVVLESPKQIDELVDSMAKAISEGKLTVSEVRNYRGPYGAEYLSEAHMEKLSEAVLQRYKATGKGPQSLTVLNSNKTIKDSGYTTTQFKVIHEGGALGELQIRGKHINELAEVEHLPYDFRSGKDLSKGNAQLKGVYSPLQSAIKNLSEEEYKLYQDYFARYYKYCRDLENGNPFLKPVKPALPEGFSPVLAVENLYKIQEQVSRIKSNSLKLIA